MNCCWNGEDGNFNDYELARAWAVYSTFLLLTPIYLYLVYSFTSRRNNYEMDVREPNCIILVSFICWLRVLFDALYHLTMDLEVNHQYMFYVTGSLPEFFNFLSYFCITSCLSAYFYRVWNFWFKNVAAREAENYNERRSIRLSSETFYFTRNRRFFGNPKIVIPACLIWLVTTTVPLCLPFIGVEISNTRVLRIVTGSCAFIPLLCLEIFMLYKCTNLFGILVEFKVTLATFAAYYIIAACIEFSAVQYSYYRILIDFEIRAFLICAYFLWLKHYIWSFAVDKKDTWCSKNCILKTISSALERKSWKISKNKLDEYTLNDILSNKKGYDLLRKHLLETLCVENLLFFVDVYRHRKSLAEDPFLQMLEKEPIIIKDLAKIEMKWIDNELQKKPETIPSSKDIYTLYIKPLSILEVNIPGRMRKNIISKFEGALALVSACESSKAISKTVEMTDTSKPELSKFKRALSLPLSATAEKFIWEQKRASLIPVRKGRMTEPAISYLYPAWKTLVLLLMNDSFPRFRALGKWSRCSKKERESLSII